MLKKVLKPCLLALAVVSVAMTAVSGIFTGLSKAYRFSDGTVASAGATNTVFDEGVSVPYSQVTAAKTFYVSPNGDNAKDGTSLENAVSSVKQAQIYAREYYQSGGTGDVLILLDDGEYYFDSTLELLPNDTKGGTLHFRSINPNKATISGAKRVNKADVVEEQNAQLGSGRVWKIPYEGEKINQLYVGETYGIRARYPDLGEELRLLNVDNTLREVVVDRKDIEGFKADDFDGSTFVVDIMWSESYIRVKDVVYKTETVKSDGKTYTTDTARIAIEGEDNFVFAREGLTIRPRCAYHFENAKPFLTTEGEWFLDETEDVIYYLPRANETLDNTQIRIPSTETLISATGKLSDKVDGVVFEGLNFKYTANGIVDGKVGGQANRNDNVATKRISGGLNDGRPVAALSFTYAKNLSFSGNIFSVMGGGAIDFVQGVESSSVQKNVFRTVGGNGILASATAYDINIVPTDERTFIKDVDVSNNFFTEIGWQDYDACAVIFNYGVNVAIHHNTISNVLYTGISFGWGWVKQEYPFLQNIDVYNNRLTNCNALLSDGGPIYMIGCQPYSSIKDNYIGETYNSVYKYPEDISSGGQIWWANAGIYLDSCSGGKSEGEGKLLVHNNYVAKDANTQQYEDINALKGCYEIIEGEEKSAIYKASGVQEEGFTVLPKTAVLTGHRTNSKKVATVYGNNLGEKTDGALIVKGADGKTTQIAGEHIIEWTDRWIKFESSAYQSGEVYLLKKNGSSSNRIYATMNVDQQYCMYDRFEEYGGFTGLAKLGTFPVDLTNFEASSSMGAYTADMVGDGYTASCWSMGSGDLAPWVSFDLRYRGPVSKLIIYARSDVNQPECRGNFRVVGITKTGNEVTEIELYKTVDEGPVYGDNDLFILDIAATEYANTVWTGFRIEKVVTPTDGYFCLAEVAVIGK